MDMPLKKRKQEPGPDPAEPAARFFQTYRDCMASDGRSPPIPTRFHAPAEEGGVRAKTGPPGSRLIGGDGGGDGGSQVSAGELLPSEVTGFTILPTEEDLKHLQSGQDKNGYIKRPPNAFIVWSHIHRRHALRKICPGANVIGIGIVLGCEWSKLSKEQKRPYYEVAHQLKRMHKQKFPDYEFRPRKKKDIECLSSGQRAGQDPGMSFSQAVPPAQSKLKGPSMYPYPSMVPYTVGYYPYPPFTPCHQMGLYSRVWNNRPRYPNTSSSTEEVRNYHNTHPQRDEAASESLKQPDVDTRPQRSAINKVECKRVDDVGVIGDIQHTKDNTASDI